MKLLIKKTLKSWPLAIIIIFGLIPLIWFQGRPGIIIDGSDTNFPLDPVGWFGKRLYVWNPALNAGTDFSSSTAGLFFHLVQVVPYKLGLSLQATQITSLVFWFGLILISGYLLAKIIWPDKPLVQLAFATIYAFNPYMFNTWENAKVSNIALVIALPLSLTILTSLQKNKISRPSALLFSCLAGLLVSGGGINPAYFLVFALVFWLYTLVEIVTNLKNNLLSSTVRNAAIVFFTMVAVNAFWILPTINFVYKNIGPFGSIDKVGYTNWVDSLSRNTSLFNVLRLQGAWDWYSFESSGQPTYIPYSINYFYRKPFIIFSLLIPALSIAALVFSPKKHRNKTLFFGLLLLIGTFMGAGTHLPTGSLFRWLLLNHVPFFSLFRSPWYIFTPLITLAYAGLIGLFFDMFGSKFVKLANLGLIVLIFGNLVYNYPLITGKIFRSTMADNFLIKFPSYVFDSQKWLTSIDSRTIGRMLSYPADEVERFKWGYNGIDSILSLISPVETLFAPLNAPESPISQLLRETYQSLSKSEIESAKNLAAKLNIGLIFNKNDQNTINYGLPQEVKDSLVARFDQWSFYKFPGDASFTSKIYSPQSAYFGFPVENGSKFLSALTKNQILLSPQDSVIENLPAVTRTSGKIIIADNSLAQDLLKFETQSHTTISRVVDRDPSVVRFDFTSQEDGPYDLLLEKYGLENSDVSFDAKLDDQNVTLSVAKTTDSYLYFNPVYLKSGTHSLVFNVRSQNLISGGDFEHGKTFQEIGEAVIKVVDGEGNKYLDITNKNKSAPEPSARFSVNKFDPLSVYLVKLKYREIYGNVALIDVLQHKGNSSYRKISEGLPNAVDWQTYSFYFRPIPTQSEMSVDLVAPFISNVFGTRVLYDDLTVYPVFTNRLILVKKPNSDLVQPQITFNQISPVLYQGQVNGATGPHMIVFSENYSPEWQLKLTDKFGKSISLNPPHFSTNLYANGWFIESPLGDYRISIFYKPQTTRNIGVAVSLLTILMVIFLYLIKHRTK